VKYYETIFIILPDLPEEVRDKTVQRYQQVLTENKAELLLTDDWGRRRLAYEIKGFGKGHYVLFEYLAQPSAVAEMERQMRLDDNVLRFLTVKKADTFDRAAFEARQAQKAPAEPEPEPKTEPEAEAEPRSEPEAETEPKAEPEAEPEVKPEAEAEPKAETESEPETEPEEDKDPVQPQSSAKAEEG